MDAMMLGDIIGHGGKTRKRKPSIFGKMVQKFKIIKKGK
jgi:hypothetical protein